MEMTLVNIGLKICLIKHFTNNKKLEGGKARRNNDRQQQQRLIFITIILHRDNILKEN